MGFRVTQPLPGQGLWDQYVISSISFVPYMVYSQGYRFFGDQVLLVLRTLRAFVLAQ
jgi:hypothetical protein